MKKIFFLSALVFVLFLPKANAQETVSKKNQKAITERLDNFFKATRDKDWDTVLDYTYEKLFTLVPREQMKTLFEQLSAQGMEIDMGSFKVNDFTGMAKSEGSRFVNIDYSMEMTIKFTGEEFTDPSVLEIMKNSFETTYGPENVKYEEASNSFKMNANKYLFAIAPMDSMEWKFVENNAEQAFILEQIIPEDVRKVFSE